MIESERSEPRRADRLHSTPRATTSSMSPPPKELYIDAKWDKLIDATLRRVVYGGLAGALAGLLVARE